MQKLGQHFLKNKSVIKKIIASLELKEGEAVIEIGPGHGELTMALREIARPSGSKIVVIEKDEELAAELERLKEPNGVEIKVIKGDALKVLGDASLSLGKKPYALVGNIPYYITGKLLRTTGELSHKPTVCIFMVQKEVALRATNIPPRMNRLSASIQFWARPSILASVPRTDFAPPPNVDSALLRLDTLPQKSKKEESGYYKVLAALFAQPRKTILNNISQASTLSREIISKNLMDCGIIPENRPQNLAVQDIMAIARSEIAASLKSR